MKEIKVKDLYKAIDQFVECVHESIDLFGEEDKYWDVYFWTVDNSDNVENLMPMAKSYLEKLAPDDYKSKISWCVEKTEHSFIVGISMLIEKIR